jgi:integrase
VSPAFEKRLLASLNGGFCIILTVVSLLLELGTPPHVVQAIARHADLDVTMRIYAHTNLDTMREALDKIDWDAE